MSIQVMSLVWEHYKRGGSEKLALLALADWCDDAGGSLHPSIATIARKICISEHQARRIVHGFIDAGLLDVVGNHNGGDRTQTRRYRLKLDRLRSFANSRADSHTQSRAGSRTGASPDTGASPAVDASPVADAHHPSHRCTSPLSPVLAKPPRTTKEPSDPRRSACPTASKPSPQSGFTAFWQAYPNKKSRGDAEKAWKALRPDAELADAILQAVACARTSAQWTQDNGKFIPHPATWLRGKRWMDEDSGNGGSADTALPVWDR